jgi:hypothetical protein
MCLVSSRVQFSTTLLVPGVVIVSSRVQFRGWYQILDGHTIWMVSDTRWSYYLDGIRYCMVSDTRWSYYLDGIKQSVRLVQTYVSNKQIKNQTRLPLSGFLFVLLFVQVNCNGSAITDEFSVRNDKWVGVRFYLNPFNQFRFLSASACGVCFDDANLALFQKNGKDNFGDVGGNVNDVFVNDDGNLADGDNCDHDIF